MNRATVVLLQMPGPERERGPERQRRQHLSGRIALRLCARLHPGAPRGPWPQLAGGAPLPLDGFYWSRSHKPLLGAAAIATVPIGLDVEHIVPRSTPVLKRISDAAQRAFFAGEEWDTTYRIWTAKEAVLKGNSVGIGHLERCTIVARPNDEELVVTFGAVRWRAYFSALAGGHIAALACREADGLEREAVRWACGALESLRSHSR